MNSQEISFTPSQAFTKRALDILLSIVFIVSFSPWMLLLIILIKTNSPGPVFYKYRRLGPDGRAVYVYKFRTMVISEDGPIIAQATKNDPRVTPLGAFLRRTALDELPTFLNVLAGNMSIVGPRPKHQAEYDHYQTIRKLVVKAKPGITSTARGFGYSSTPELSAVEALYDLEVAYVRDWSLWNDLKIIWQTVSRAFLSSNAY